MTTENEKTTEKIVKKIVGYFNDLGYMLSENQIWSLLVVVYNSLGTEKEADRLGGDSSSNRTTSPCEDTGVGNHSDRITTPHEATGGVPASSEMPEKKKEMIE